MPLIAVVAIAVALVASVLDAALSVFGLALIARCRLRALARAVLRRRKRPPAASRRLSLGRNGAEHGRIAVWSGVWIARPHSIPVFIGVCGLCRALTPPKHHRGAREGSGPGTGSSWWRDRETEVVGRRNGRERRQKSRKDREERRREQNKKREGRSGRGGGWRSGGKRGAGGFEGVVGARGERGASGAAARGKRHPNLVIGWRVVRCGSSSEGACG
jgi:uncharacterized membrane protein YgcG